MTGQKSEWERSVFSVQLLLLALTALFFNAHKVDSDSGRGERVIQESPLLLRSPSSHVMDDGRMILVVDDDFVVKHVLKEWLVAAGYKCLVANSAEQGWRVIKDFARQIWLVILDVQMPGKYDGIGLLDRIIEVAQIRSLKVRESAVSVCCSLF